MLTWSAIILAATAIGGLALFALYDWIRPDKPVWPPGAAHGLLGAIGFAMLLLGLYGPESGPPRGVHQGASQFGAIAAVFVGVGLALGAVLFVGRLRGKWPPGMVIGIHASLAVGGLVMLAAYLAAPA